MKKATIYTHLVFLMGTLISCTSNYRMTTRISPNGEVEREVYAQADSISRTDMPNPFLFQTSNGWEVEVLTPAVKQNFFGKEETMNIKARRILHSSDGLSFFSPQEEWMRPLAVPHEKLEKHFRWFYTYYTYTCTYPEITEKGPVPLSKYLNEQEQALLFLGNMDGYQGMNGIELKEELDNIGDKFQQWLYRSLFELSYEVVTEFLHETGDTLYLPRIINEKEAVFKADSRKSEGIDCSPQYLCELLDKQYKTSAFDSLFHQNKARIEQSFDKKCITIELFNYQIKFELEMPGKLLLANTTLKENGVPVWKVDAYRLLTGNYTLKAESRTVNVYAFCLTGLFILLAGYGFIRRK